MEVLQIMKIIGLRASANEFRYAILERDANGNIVFVNKDFENRIKYPATIEKIEEKVYWVKSEIDRIFRINPTIQKVYIKTNEYATETATRRETTYMDSIFLLSAREHNLPVERKLNNQIDSTSSKAKEYAENRVGRTQKYWNNTMADAILAAWWGIKHNV